MLSSVVRPWGEYVVVGSGEGFQVKLITVNPNCRLSLQSHKFRAETWYIVSGSANIQIGEDILTAREGDVFHVPVGVLHRIGSSFGVKFVEIQTGSYFGEDDIVRFDDDYGRL